MVCSGRQPHESALRSWLFRNHQSLKGELDDIVQESYLRLLRARTEGPIQCARTYLFGIARYVVKKCIAVLRKHAPHARDGL